MLKHGARFAALIGFVVPMAVACGVFSPPTPTPTPRPTPLPPGYTVSGKTMGDPNAKVTLVEFADFQ
jgi:hypothetical protein